MKKTLAALAVAMASLPVLAQTYVQPHVTKNGTYVQGHVRSAPDGNPHNNYSTSGNVNPYTGAQGHVNPYQQPSPYNPYGRN